MKYGLFVSLLPLFVGCMATMERDQGDVKTIGYYTGSLSTEEGMYRGQFERGAEKACGGEFEILERTRTPSTLSGMDLPSSKFYWVIRCAKPTAKR